MTNSRQKGKRGELEACREMEKVLTGTTWRRSQQFCGKAGDADIIGVDKLHVEVKRREAGLKTLYSWMAQAVEDARATDTPLVLTRSNGEDWLAVIYLQDLPSLYEILWGIYENGDFTNIQENQ